MTGFEVKIPPATEAKVDPVETLKCYIQRTEDLRTNDKSLFLSHKAPYKGIKSDTIAKDLQAANDYTTLRGKGFTAKCFRPSCATASIKSGVQPLTAMQIGRWKTQEVFVNHYVYPNAPSSYTDSVIQLSGH